ncbi:MAG: hypothetical protein U0228_31710 [Myxococcaceae bacterium]
MLKLLTAALTLSASLALAQYNPLAGHNAPAPAAEKVQVRAADGKLEEKIVYKEVKRDSYGNATGSQYDLAVNGAFSGQTVLIIDLYNQPMPAAEAAIKQKGFSVVHYHQVPSLKEFTAGLEKSNQVWIIASCDDSVHLSKEHQQAVKRFFDSGHGVYLWGDNDPCNADADSLASMLIDARVKGDLPGDQVVSRSDGPGKPGVVRDHLLSTGVENVYEGVTVATVKPSGKLTPVIWGSAGNLITAAFEDHGKRLILDGGYTRLSYKWESAGTGRYVMNAAAWLANYERFGDAVVGKR